MKGVRLRRLIIVVAFVGTLGLNTHALRAAKPKTWNWTPEQLKQVSTLEQQVTRRKDGFYLLTTGRFDVHTDISPRFAAETSLFMDAFYNGFSTYLFKTLGAPKPAKPTLRAGFVAKAPGTAASGPVYFPRKPRVVIYAGAASYRKHFKNGSGGIFVYSFDAKGNCVTFNIYAYARTALERKFAYFPVSTLMHETTHCLLQAMAGRGAIEPWFNEGFAQLVDSCSATDLMEGRLKPREKFWRNHMLKYAGDGWHKQGPSLTKLLAIKNWNTDKMGSETRYRYALAFNFVEFLFSTDSGRLKLKVMLGRLVKRSRPLLNERDSWALQQEWHTYLKKTIESTKSKRSG